MSNVRRLGGGAPTPAPASNYQPTGIAPALPQQHATAPATQPQRPAPSQAPASIRVPSYAGAAAIPPVDSAVDTSRVGEYTGREKRDDAYWEAHPFKAGTFELDVFVNKIVDWSVGRVSITLQVSQWDRNGGGEKGRPGEHHQRPIDWDHSRPDLIAKMRQATHPFSGDCKCDPCKAHRGLQYWRAEMVAAYTSADIPESKFPIVNGNAVIPWWQLLFHQCPDGVMVPVMLTATIAVQAGRQKWPTIRAIHRITETNTGRPFQAPMPYAVPPYFAEDMRWTIAEQKTWGTQDGRNGTAQIAILDRNAVPLGHCNLPTYKDL